MRRKTYKRILSLDLNSCDHRGSSDPTSSERLLLAHPGRSSGDRRVPARDGKADSLQTSRRRSFGSARAAPGQSAHQLWRHYDSELWERAGRAR